MSLAGYTFSWHGMWWVDPASSQALPQQDGGEMTKNKNEKINGLG